MALSIKTEDSHTLRPSNCILLHQKCIQVHQEAALFIIVKNLKQVKCASIAEMIYKLRHIQFNSATKMNNYSYTQQHRKS